MTHQERQKEISKEWIEDAFYSLLQKKDYDSITVSEIAQKAGLSRRTFYRAFESKQDIITYLLVRIFSDYIAALKRLPVKTREHLAVAIVDFVNQHLAFFQCLKRNHLDHLLIDFFDKQLAAGRDEIWGGSFCDDEETERVFMMTISIEHYNVIRLWLELHDKKTPEEMAELLSDALALFRHFQ